MEFVLDQSMTLENALNLGHEHHQAARYGEAMAVYEAIIAQFGDCAPAHVNLGVLLLLHGNFERGWRELEWRRHGQPGQLPTWDGGTLQGERILVRGEQGAGDNIQFLRYAPLIAERGGQPVVLTLPGMKRLIAGIDGIDEVLEPGDSASGLAKEVPVLSLPGLFADGNDLPRTDVPYLSVASTLSGTWANRLAVGEMSVGLCWQGNPDKPRDQLRSIPLRAFEPLMRIDGIKWFGLQVGAGEDQVEHLDGTLPFTHLGAELGANPDRFVEAAAAIANLDLVISVDTAIAHLAGAMGRPVWILLPHVPDWRWHLGREDSPWYPSARLFRQEIGEDWSPVIDRLATYIKELVRE